MVQSHVVNGHVVQGHMVLVIEARAIWGKVTWCSVICGSLPAQEASVLHPVREACASHPDVLKQPQVQDLVFHPLVIHQQRRLLLVRLDAPHVVRLLGTGGRVRECTRGNSTGGE